MKLRDVTWVDGIAGIRWSGTLYGKPGYIYYLYNKIDTNEYKAIHGTSLRIEMPYTSDLLIVACWLQDKEQTK